MTDGFIWYDKTATDDRVWCVKRGDVTVRARDVYFESGHGEFKPEGFAELRPGGPRGVIFASEIETTDEVPCG